MRCCNFRSPTCLVEAGAEFSEGALSLWGSQVVSEASLSQLARQSTWDSTLPWAVARSAAVDAASHRCSLMPMRR